MISYAKYHADYKNIREKKNFEYRVSLSTLISQYKKRLLKLRFSHKLYEKSFTFQYQFVKVKF